jgi:hypothetical protein
MGFEAKKQNYQTSKIIASYGSKKVMKAQTEIGIES